MFSSLCFKKLPVLIMKSLGSAVFVDIVMIYKEWNYLNFDIQICVPLKNPSNIKLAIHSIFRIQVGIYKTFCTRCGFIT